MQQGSKIQVIHQVIYERESAPGESQHDSEISNF